MTSPTRDTPASAGVPVPAPFRQALLFVAAVTAWRLVLLFTGGINLSFDEAQYWHWAQTPALGYFSKPPLIAWMITLTTAIGGNGEAWVRLGATLSHAATALVLFAVARALFRNRDDADRIALWSALIWITLPAVSVSAMIISTDAPLLLCWSVALLALIRALEADGTAWRWWALLGGAIGVGLLAKYAMAFFVVSLLLFLLVSPADRIRLRQPGPWLALAVGLVVYSPNLLWNLLNGMASYRHTGENANLKSHLFNPAELAEFFGSQFGVFGPLLFAVLVVMLTVALRRSWLVRRYRLLICFVAPVLLAITLQSFLSRANANWAATAFVAAVPLVTAWLMERDRWRWLLPVSASLHLLAAVALYNPAPLLSLVGIPMNAKLDLQKRLRGWDVAGDWARDLAVRNPDLVPLFDDRKTMATLLYYGRPLMMPARMWNPEGKRQNHYELSASLPADPGGNYLLLTRGDAAWATPYFERVETVGILRLPVYPDYTLELQAYRLTGFKGYAAGGAR